MTSGVGESYTAKFDGKDYPFKGNRGVDEISLRKFDVNTIEETAKRGGKVVDVSRLTVSPDGRSMTIVDNDKVQGATSKITAMKQ